MREIGSERRGRQRRELGKARERGRKGTGKRAQRRGEREGRGE